MKQGMIQQGWRAAQVAVLLMVSLTATAQPNYRYILKHMGEWTDMQRLYWMDDYRAWHPKEANPYYWMGNIYWRLQADEHPIADYTTKMRYLYEAGVCYGNCRAYLLDDEIRLDKYPEVAVDGKVSDGAVWNYLNAHQDSVQQARQQTEQLYNAYYRLVMDYDSCRALFTAFSMRYDRIKDACLLYDSVDESTLRVLRDLSQQLPADIDSLQLCLTLHPVAVYHPVFRFRSIDLFRIDGLAGSDMLRDEVLLWDYSQWLSRFDRDRTDVEALRREMQTEQERLSDRLAHPSAQRFVENTHLLNHMEQVDEGTPMSLLMHAQWQTAALQTLQKQTERDSVTADEWIVCLQLAYRMQQQYEPLQKTFVRLRTLLQRSDNQRIGRCQPYYKYQPFIDQWYGNGGIAPANWGTVATARLKLLAERAWFQTQQWLLTSASLYALPTEVQIAENTVAEVDTLTHTIRFLPGQLNNETQP